MASKRKFYKTIIKVTVLSEEQYSCDELTRLAYDICEGDCVGSIDRESAEELTATQTVDALFAMSSEPGFFQLTEDGDDTFDREEVDDSIDAPDPG